MKGAARKVARAIRSQQRGPSSHRATITRWSSEDDFVADLHGYDLTLDEEDVTLGQTVRKYDADTGLEVGDTLVLMEPSEGDFVAVDVES